MLCCAGQKKTKTNQVLRSDRCCTYPYETPASGQVLSVLLLLPPPIPPHHLRGEPIRISLVVNHLNRANTCFNYNTRILEYPSIIIYRARPLSNFHLTILCLFFDLLEPLLAGLRSILHLGNVSAIVEQKVVVHITQLFESLHIFQSTENEKMGYCEDL